MTIQDILTKLGSTQDASEFNDKDPYDVLIVGGGPASGSAAIYTARKGLRTGIVADRIGGQVNDTAGIENFITVKKQQVQSSHLILLIIFHNMTLIQ